MRGHKQTRHKNGRMSQKKGEGSHGVVCLSPAMQLHSPPVLPVSVSVSATDPVSLLTSAGRERTQKKRREEGWERGGGVGRDGAEGWREEKRREEKRRGSLAASALSQYDRFTSLLTQKKNSP